MTWEAGSRPGEARVGSAPRTVENTGREVSECGVSPWKSRNGTERCDVVLLVQGIFSISTSGIMWP